MCGSNPGIKKKIQATLPPPFKTLSSMKRPIFLSFISHYSGKEAEQKRTFDDVSTWSQGELGAQCLGSLFKGEDIRVLYALYTSSDLIFAVVKLP